MLLAMALAGCTQSREQAGQGTARSALGTYRLQFKQAILTATASGYEGAVNTCVSARDEVSKRVSDVMHVRLGRLSDSPASAAAPEWAKPSLVDTQRQLWVDYPSDAPVVRVTEPIVMMTECAGCHGANRSASLDAAIGPERLLRMPKDIPVGGRLGVMWAEFDLN